MHPEPVVSHSHGASSPSLPEVHRSVIVPPGAGFWRKVLAFSGPGFLVAVGYMDPGNWATDIAGGSRFAYQLIFVLMMSNLIAILVQALAARLGIVTQMDLAQACKLRYSRRTTIVLWVLCEIAIAACDLAEVIGSAIALNLLFHIPLLLGVCLTALDVLAILYLQHKGFRYLEAVVVTLIGVIGGCYLMELLILVRPRYGGHRQGVYPHNANSNQSGDALHCHRNAGCHRDAPQSLPAFLPGADARH
jgi:manganese transport protein